MPQFDLRNIKVAEYVNNNGTVTYTNKTSVGDSMTVDLNVKHAEGRLYAEGTLAEYMKKIIGGTMSIGVKYIPAAAQQLMYGMREKTRTVGTGTVTGLAQGGNDKAKYVGCAFFAPDMIDGVEKYTCVQVKRVLFGPPGMSLKTMGENIQFATPTTSGEFLPDHTPDRDIIETATVDTMDEAAEWVDAVLS